MLIFIIPLLVGLILGGAISWLYFKANTKSISAGDYEAIKNQLQLREKELAVTTDRMENLANDLNAANKTIESLRADNQKHSNEIAGITTERNNVTRQLQKLTEDNMLLAQQQQNTLKDYYEGEKKLAHLQAELAAMSKRLETQKNDFNEIKQNLEKEFKVIAGTILTENSKNFTDQQTVKLNDLLTPFREQINSFKTDVETKFNTEAIQKGSLKQQIDSLISLNQSIAKEALALTEALKGSTKKQGDWGEDILERILEYSGLQKNVHYFIQQQFQNEEGQKIRPDVVVHYPDKRYLVIDAKVSLSHYWDYCNAATPEEQAVYLPKIIASMKTHIDGLAARKYTDISGTLDFIIMFTPVEAAYIIAMQNDHSLWQYAYDKKVLLISPTNLLPAMKMINIMWEKDMLNKESEAIVAKAIKLYEKFQGFIITFESVGSEIEQAHKKWTDARGQLHTGRDNIINQGSKLKLLFGTKTNKELPAGLVELGELDANNNMKS